MEQSCREGLNNGSLTSERRVKRCKESRIRGNPARLWKIGWKLKGHRECGVPRYPRPQTETVQICMEPVEPPCTDRYARWWERTAVQLMGGLLLDPF